MSGTMVPSGLLGVPTGGPTATQGDLYNAIVGMGWAPQGYGPIPAPQAPQAAAPTAYDKWGHVVTGQPQPPAAATVPSLNVGPGLAAPMPPQAAAGPGADFVGTQVPAATAAPGAINPGASGYDMWGRQAPPPAQAVPQLPGLADILAMIQAAQARQAANAPAPTGLLSDGASEGGGGGAEGTM